MNRGIAKRTLFESERDIRRFLSQIARAVRADLIEVHAYCIMTTHFHLLVRSPRGRLSEALQRIQNQYVRWFNRARHRDGPLVRGRFISKPVRSDAYCCNLVRYIDFNPVSANLVEIPALYPHGSARCYARPRGPRWLTRGWVEGIVRGHAGIKSYDPSAYPPCFGIPLSAGLARLVERRLRFADRSVDPLDDLLRAAVPGVRAWMVRKAALADGAGVGVPLCDPTHLSEVIGEEIDLAPWSVSITRKRADGWVVARAGLLRDICGLTLAETAAHCRTDVNRITRLLHMHARLLTADETYAERAASLSWRALRNCHGESENTVPEQFLSDSSRAAGHG
ncbi:MAG TPA: transposase [Planctomycetota bacterium]|nr:transposase [Planctomycetota bacterium]